MYIRDILCAVQGALEVFAEIAVEVARFGIQAQGLFDQRQSS